MKPMRSCYLKALAIQLCLRPESFGVKRPSLALLADSAKVSAQSLGRILINLREKYPSFVARCMRSEAVREIYRQAQLARLEPDQEAFIQLTIPFGPGNSN